MILSIRSRAVLNMRRVGGWSPSATTVVQVGIRGKPPRSASPVHAGEYRAAVTDRAWNLCHGTPGSVALDPAPTTGDDMAIAAFTAGLIVGAVVATVLCAAWAYDAMSE